MEGLSLDRRQAVRRRLLHLRVSGRGNGRAGIRPGDGDQLEHGEPYRDFYQFRVVPDSWHGTTIDIIRPDTSLTEIGVGSLWATPEGVDRAKGVAFVDMLPGS